MSFEKLESALKFSTVTSRGGKSVSSITITFTESNGKRITLSNELMNILCLVDKVFVGVVIDERKLVLSNHPVDGADTLKISKRNIYNANAVSGIIEVFGLQPMYDGHTSHTFKDIEVDADSGIAIVTVPVVEGK